MKNWDWDEKNKEYENRQAKKIFEEQCKRDPRFFVPAPEGSPSPTPFEFPRFILDW